MKTITRKKETFTEKIKNSKPSLIFTAAAYFILGFILSSCFVLRAASPFSVSLISVSKRSSFVYSALGSAVGYLLFCPEDFARYAVAVIIVSLGTFAVSLAELKNQPYLPMLISFLSLLVTGLVVDIKTGALPMQYMLTLAESLLGLGGTFFFFKAVNCARIGFGKHYYFLLDYTDKLFKAYHRQGVACKNGGRADYTFNHALRFG